MKQNLVFQACACMLCINEMDLPSPIATIKISKMCIDYLNEKKEKKEKNINKKEKNVLEIKDKSKIDRIREIKIK